MVDLNMTMSSYELALWAVVIADLIVLSYLFVMAVESADALGNCPWFKKNRWKLRIHEELMRLCYNPETKESKVGWARYYLPDGRIIDGIDLRHNYFGESWRIYVEKRRELPTGTAKVTINGVEHTAVISSTEVREELIRTGTTFASLFSYLWGVDETEEFNTWQKRILIP